MTILNYEGDPMSTCSGPLLTLNIDGRFHPEGVAGGSPTSISTTPRYVATLLGVCHCISEETDRREFLAARLNRHEDSVSQNQKLLVYR